MMATALHGGLGRSGGAGAFAARFTAGLPLALLITALLMLMMRSLIAVDAGPSARPTDPPDIVITSNRPDTPPDTERDRPQPPVEVVTPPAPPRIPPGESVRPDDDLGGATGALPEPDAGDLIPLEPGLPTPDGGARPIVRMEPVYPRSAAASGLEGECAVTFDINPDGVPANVAATCTSAVFVSASVRAVERWRYQPQIVAGEPVVQRGEEVALTFSMEE